MAVVAFLVLAVSASGADATGKLKLRVDGPTSVRVGQPLSLRFTVTHVGGSGLYFKQPWHWASDGMRVVATAADGSVRESSTALFDIDGTYLCTYFKPLSPGDRFSFEDSIVIGPKPVFEPSSPPSPEAVAMMIRPDLDLRPGHYKLRWVYEPKISADESVCTAAGLPIWAGYAESPEMDLHVVE